jgi:AcrR family transcriptional regulator
MQPGVQLSTVRVVPAERRKFAACSEIDQQPTAAWSTRQASASRAGERDATFRRKLARGIVWMLSKLTTQSVGTPSSRFVNSSSETSMRRLLVSAATTVYLHFGSRAGLVDALFQHLAEREKLDESTRPVWEAPDAATALEEWARHLANYHPRLIAVTRAVERVQRVDADAARHRQRVVRGQIAGCRRLATWLDEEGRLAPPWTVDTATDMLWALISTDMIEGLLVERNWSRRRLTEHLAVLLRATFTTPSGG